MRISDWSSDVCSSDLPILRDRLMDGLMKYAKCKGARPARRSQRDAECAGVEELEGDYEPLMMGGESLQIGRGGELMSGGLQGREIGRASWRERVLQYV